MESLAVLLEPHKQLIGSAASGIAYLHQCSGFFVCNAIRKQKSTVGHSVLPFLNGAIISALAIGYGVVLNDEPTMRVSAIGTALNIGYILFYFYYTNNIKDRALAWSQLGYGGAFVAVVYAYMMFESKENLPFRFGLIITAVLFYLIGSPLLGLGEIIRKRSTEGLPFPIILTGTLVSFLWLLYGIATRINFVILQNGVVFAMSITQLSLFAIFPSTPAKPKKNGNNKKKN